MRASLTFQQDFDATDFRGWRQRSLAATNRDVAQALSGQSRGLERFAALISPAAGERLEELARAAHQLTLQRFGRVLQMYAPLYVSNECIDTCTYCGYSFANDIHRVTLDADAIEGEARILLEQGFRHVLLVSGEHPRLVSTGYLADVVRRLRPLFASVAIEVAPQYEEGYRELAQAGVDTLAIYQETYDRELYQRYHLAGRKRNFDWRLATPERAARAGIKRIGIGSLLGLGDWRHDALATFFHAQWLQTRLWRCQISVSVPRLQAAIGFDGASRPVGDSALVQYVCALRLCLPDVGLVLSTRERPQLRDGLVRLGITSLSAGSQTEPGGYSAPDADAEQFEVADDRSPAQVAARLRQLGYEVVWKDWEASLHG